MRFQCELEGVCHKAFCILLDLRSVSSVFKIANESRAERFLEMAKKPGLIDKFYIDAYCLSYPQEKLQ